jgi:hypothetical protein
VQQDLYELVLKWWLAWQCYRFNHRVWVELRSAGKVCTQHIRSETLVTWVLLQQQEATSGQTLARLQSTVQVQGKGSVAMDLHNACDIV